jgi:hypothetical protein
LWKARQIEIGSAKEAFAHHSLAEVVVVTIGLLIVTEAPVKCELRHARIGAQMAVEVVIGAHRPVGVPGSASD